MIKQIERVLSLIKIVFHFFLKKGNDDVFIANKDKKFLLSNIKKELDNSIDKYTNHGENKNRIEKLKKRINLGGVKFF